MSFPDYYKVLNIPQSASLDEVRQAYKKESLRTHPDRLVNAPPEERQRATERFQAVADAFYVLSDKVRRKEYDSVYNSRRREQSERPSFFNDEERRPDAEGVFTDVFEELLRPEVERRSHFWSWLGAICAAGLGFIIANIPGALVGAVAGNRLGAIRDAKGKSVAAVFNELGSTQKAEILRALVLKVLGSAL